MRKIIEGKVYDTRTAEHLCDISPIGFSPSDFQWESTYLYRSPRGAFFIAGEGGARSRWAERVGQSGSCGGRGLQVLSEEEAKRLVERHASDNYEDIFGAAEEG